MWFKPREPKHEHDFIHTRDATFTKERRTCACGLVESCTLKKLSYAELVMNEGVFYKEVDKNGRPFAYWRGPWRKEDI